MPFSTHPDATLILAERVILRASLRVEAVFGWTPRELEGQSIRILYPGQTDYELIGERARKAMLTTAVYRDERFMRRKDGQVVWMEGRGAGPGPETIRSAWRSGPTGRSRRNPGRKGS